jgi:hypothetical protein
MDGRDVFAGVEIGDRTANADDLVVGPGNPSQSTIKRMAVICEFATPETKDRKQRCQEPILELVPDTFVGLKHHRHVLLAFWSVTCDRNGAETMFMPNTGNPA